MKMIKGLTCFVFLLLSLGLEAQNRDYSDSLQKVFQQQELSLKDRFDLARKIAFDHPDPVEALRFSNISLEIAMELGDLFYQAQAYEEIGTNQRLLGNKTESVSAALKALEIFEKLDSLEAQAASLVQLGSNLISDDEFEQAIGLFRKAIEYYNGSGRSLNHALTLINMGEAYRLASQLDNAIYNFKQALNLNEQLNNEIVEGYAKGNLGMALRSNGDLEEARAELNPAIEILTRLGDPYSVSVYTAELAQINIVEGKPRLAEQQLLEAYSMAKREGLKEQIRDFSEMLVDFYEKSQDYSLALEYQKVYQVYQDSLVNKKNVQEVERIKANYQIDKREREISLLNQVNAKQWNFNLALGSGILVFGILASLLYQSIQQKNEANGMLSKQQLIVTKREEEKALLLKELNHRVKNNLQMVSSLLSLQENQLQGHPAAEAINAGKSRVEALSLIHQKLYQDDVHTTINIKEYLEQLVSNLFYSHGDPFQPNLELRDIQMDIDTAIPVSLIVNELVTNALKYAYKGIQNPEMFISLDMSHIDWILEISDNGIGLDKDKDTSNSFGLKLVRSLVDQIDGTLEVRDVPNGGVAWKVTIRKYQNENA